LKKPDFTKVFFLGIIIILFYAIILFAFDIEKIIFTINQINPFYYIMIFPITGLTLIVQGWRYQLTLRKLNIVLSFKDSFLIYAAGLSMLLTPGGTGSLVKSYFLKIKTGKSISSTSPIIIYEKWLELIAIITIIGIFLIPVSIFESQIIFIIGSFLSGFIFFAFKNSMGINLLNKTFKKFSFLNGLTLNVDEFQSTTKILCRPKTLFQLLSITFLSKFLPMISVFLVFKLFNNDIDIFTSSLIYFSSLVAGLLTFIPCGMIITEAGLLGLSLKFGFDLSTATVLVILIRLLTFWFPVFIGFFSLKFISMKK